MLKKMILSTTFIISSILLTACFDSNNADLSEASHQITAVSVLGTSSEASTAIANGSTDSNANATDFEILLPLDDLTLSADPGDGSTVSNMINLQVTGGTANTTTVNIGFVIAPF